MGGRGEAKGDPGQDPNPSWWPCAGDLPKRLWPGLGSLLAPAARRRRESPNAAECTPVLLGFGQSRDIQAPLLHLQRAHTHQYNFPRDNRSVLYHVVSTHLRLLMEKLHFSQKCHLFWQKMVFVEKSMFSQKYCTREKMLSSPTNPT